MKDLLSLFIIFSRIGAVNFGGGYAMLPLLQKEFVEKRNWATDEELMDYYAIGQCTPGVIAVNVSTFIGYKRKGVIGGVVATLGFLSVPILLLMFIAAFLVNFAEIEIVKHAFAGIRVCVCVLIVSAVVRLWKKSIVNAVALLLYLSVFICATLSITSPTILVILSAIAGIIIKTMTTIGDTTWEY